MTDETAALMARMKCEAKEVFAAGLRPHFDPASVVALIAAYEASREEIEDMRASLDKISAEIYSTRAEKAERERGEAIADPAEIARYVASARELYALADGAIELPDPPIVVRTASGARVLAWLPIEDEDLTAA